MDKGTYFQIISNFCHGSFPVSPEIHINAAEEPSVLNDFGDTSRAGKSIPHGILGYNFLFSDNAGDASAWGLSFLFSNDHFLTDMLYIGSGLGLTCSFASSEVTGMDYKVKTSSYSIDIPVYVGVSPIEYLQLDTGPCLGYLVAGNIKTFSGGKEVSNTKFADAYKDLKRFGVYWMVSARVCDYIYVGLKVGFKSEDVTTLTLGFTF